MIDEQPRNEKIVSIREAAAMLEKGQISVADYVKGIEDAIGKEKFWEIYNRHLKEYFQGFNFKDSDVKNSLIKEQEKSNE